MTRDSEKQSHMHTNTHKHTRTCMRKPVVRIYEKAGCDDKEQQKGHKYTIKHIRKGDPEIYTYFQNLQTRLFSTFELCRQEVNRSYTCTSVAPALLSKDKCIAHY